MRRFLGLLLLGSLLVAENSQAQTTSQPTITYQGQIHSNGSMLSDGPHRLALTLYSDADGTVEVWRDELTAVIRNGVFSVELGSNKALPESALLPAGLWLGVRVDGSEELRPLTKLGSSLHALTIADGSITADKIAADYVASVSINGKKISGRGQDKGNARGLDLKLVGSDDIDISYDEASGVVSLKARDASSGGRNEVLNQNTYVKGTLKVNKAVELNAESGDTKVNGDVTLGTTSSNTIVFNGSAASDLKMDGFTVDGPDSVIIGSASDNGILAFRSAGGGTLTLQADALMSTDGILTLPSIEGEQVLMMASADGDMIPPTESSSVGTEDQPYATMYSGSYMLRDTSDTHEGVTMGTGCPENDPNCEEAFVMSSGPSQPMMFVSSDGTVQPGSNTATLGSSATPYMTTYTGSVSLRDTSDTHEGVVMGTGCPEDDPNCEEAFVMSSGPSQPMMFVSNDGTVQPGTTLATLGSATTPYMSTFTGSVSLRDTSDTHEGVTMGTGCPEDDPNCEEGFVMSSGPSQPMMFVSNDGTVQPGTSTAMMGTPTSPYMSTHTGSLALRDTSDTHEGYTLEMGCPEDDPNCNEQVFKISTLEAPASLLTLSKLGDLALPGTVYVRETTSDSDPLAVATKSYVDSEVEDGWKLGGNIVDSEGASVGTLDEQPFSLMTDGFERLTVQANGDIVTGSHLFLNGTLTASSNVIIQSALSVTNAASFGNELSINGGGHSNTGLAIWGPGTVGLGDMHYSRFVSPVMSSDLTYVLPATLPEQGAVLTAQSVSGSISTLTWDQPTLRSSATADLPSIGAHSSHVQTFTVETGGSEGTVHISPAQELPDGLIISQCRIDSDGHVDVKYYNATASAIDVGSISWLITVTPH